LARQICRIDNRREFPALALIRHMRKGGSNKVYITLFSHRDS
jgi:hypothetical protein